MGGTRPSQCKAFVREAVGCLSVSIVLVKVLRANRHVAIFVRAISGVKIDIAAIIFVNDTDLINVA